MERNSHRTFNLEVSPQLHLQISSDFDSGNLESATVMWGEDDPSLATASAKLQLMPAAQPFNPQYSTKQSTKTSFHFNVKATKPVCLHFIIRRMAILSIIEGSFQEYYRVCIGTKPSGHGEPEYTKEKPQDMRLVKQGDQYMLQFKYELNEKQKVYFSYHYPYSYQRICHFLQDLNENFKHSQQHNDSVGLMMGVRGVGFGQSNSTYFKNELLIESIEGRAINLLTITEIPNSLKKSGMMNLTREPRISKSLFPYYEIEDRPFKFNKPYIMVISRVHPGQTSASYALEGFIKILLGNTVEAQFLRKTFVFLIVPMINPDGVFHGTYRMDMQGHNLNRFYNSCAAHKQPAIFAISSLLQHHADDLVGFFDIHSHPQAKGTFLYGNAYSSIEDQTESQLFAKLLAINSETFQYEHCSFSQKNMNSKDINDILTKDGSSRVCAFRRMLAANICNGVHCYTIELGSHGCPTKKDNTKSDQLYQFKSTYRRQTKYLQTSDYLEHGTDLVNTICQIYVQTFRSFNIEADGSIQMQDSSYSPLQSLREETIKQIYEKDERFRIMDTGVIKKMKMIHNVICTNLYSKILKRYPLILETVRECYGRIQNKQIKQKRNSYQYHGRVIRSMELGKQEAMEIGKIQANDESEIDLKKLTDISQHKDIRNIILHGTREKINIVPLQFHIPQQRHVSQNTSARRRVLNFNRILQMQADSLPRIEKRKINFMTERHKLKQKRIQSSINTHPLRSPGEYFGLPVSRGLERKLMRVPANEKDTIDSNVEGIIAYENIMNQAQQDEDQFEKSFKQINQQYDSNYNPEINLHLNVVRNSEMFKREGLTREKVRKKSENGRQDKNEEIAQTGTRKISKSRQKLVAFGQNKNNSLTKKGLPKLHSVTQKVRNKFDLELKMKQKYDKQYRLDDKLKIEGKEKLE